MKSEGKLAMYMYFVAVFAMIFIPVFLQGEVFAAWGPGGAGSGVPADCNYQHYQHVCNDGNGLDGSHGGASWRIHKIGEWPEYSEQVLAMSKSDYDKTISDIVTYCAETGYYAAAGWDRLDGGQTGFLNGAFKFSSGNEIAYNSVGAIDSDSIIGNGAARYNGKRLTKLGAEKLFMEWNKESGPSGNYNEAGWFCLDAQPRGSGLYTASNASNRNESAASEGNDWVTTQIGKKGIVETDKREVKLESDKNETAPQNVTFSHNVYSKEANQTRIIYTVNRQAYFNNTKIGEGFKSNDGYYSISVLRPDGCDENGCGPNVNASSGQNDMNTTQTTNIGDRPSSSGVYYIADPPGKRDGRPYTDLKGGGNTNGANYFQWYVMRDFLTIRFKKAGEYKFCETISVDGAETTACAVIVVKSDGQTPPTPGPGPGPSNTCSEPRWINNTDYNRSGTHLGYTDVLSGVRVRNLDWTLSNGDWGWTDKESGYGYSSRKGFSGNREVYAKPTDTIYWLHCYYPGVLKTAETKVTRGPEDWNDLRLDRWAPVGEWPNNNEPMAGLLSSPEFQISIYRNNFTGKNANSKTFRTESKDVRAPIEEWSDSFTVGNGGTMSKTGLTLQEGISTNDFPSYVKITEYPQIWNCGLHEVEVWHDCSYWDSEGNYQPCSWVSYEYEYGGICTQGDGPDVEYNTLDTRSPSRIRDVAAVKIPYNFKNEASISIDTTNDYVYAGEFMPTVLNMTIKVGMRENNKTDGTYSTKVDNAEVRLITYVTDKNQTGVAVGEVKGHGANLCNSVPGGNYNNICNIETTKVNETGTLNEDEENNKEEKKSVDGIIYDVPAGTYYCAAVAVYPYTTNGDTDVQDERGNTQWTINGDAYSWFVSAPACKVVAKKPSIQVWGNGLFTNSLINLETSKKRVIAGVYGFPSSSDNTTIFGSWVEENIIANGKVTGLASGASTGGPGGTKRTQNEIGGSWEGKGANDCIRSPLTMPGCKFFLNTSITSPGASGSAAPMEAPVDKKTLVKRFIGESESYIYNSGVNSIGSDNNTVFVAKGDTYVIHNKGNITIVGNIQYEEGYNYLTDIPKVIVYAEGGSINIRCGVDRIDAVLIADEVVDTCINGESDNSPVRSRQLRVNGAIIANKLIAGRTYGAATGADGSGVPAEIVNYDTSLYLWGAPRADVSSSGKLDTVYQAELSPRY